MTSLHAVDTQDVDLPVVPICRGLAALILPPNHRHILRRPVLERGAFRDRHERWARDAMDADGIRRVKACWTNDADAYGEVVWS
jgi:hypothetical protein